MLLLVVAYSDAGYSACLTLPQDGINSLTLNTLYQTAPFSTHIYCVKKSHLFSLAKGSAGSATGSKKVVASVSSRRKAGPEIRLARFALKAIEVSLPLAIGGAWRRPILVPELAFCFPAR